MFQSFLGFCCLKCTVIYIEMPLWYCLRCLKQSKNKVLSKSVIRSNNHALHPSVYISCKCNWVMDFIPLCLQCLSNKQLRYKQMLSEHSVFFCLRGCCWFVSFWLTPVALKSQEIFGIPPSSLLHIIGDPMAAVITRSLLLPEETQSLQPLPCNLA